MQGHNSFLTREKSTEYFTQGHSGSTCIWVDPEGEPGENHYQQGWGINTHHVKANLSPQGEDDFHTGVVPFWKQTLC